MRKVVILVISLILFFITNSTFWETGGLVSTWTLNSTWILDSTWVLVDTWSVVETQIPTNSWSEVIDTKSIWEATYIYYYWDWCAHCANVEEYMQWVDGYDKVNITKKEIYFDDTNRAEYLATWKRLWISEADLWIPFLVINNAGKETSMIWDEKIINYFKPFLWEAQESSKKTIILVILWISAVLIPVVLIKLSNKN